LHTKLQEGRNIYCVNRFGKKKERVSPTEFMARKKKQRKNSSFDKKSQGCGFGGGGGLGGFWGGGGGWGCLGVVGWGGGWLVFLGLGWLGLGHGGWCVWFFGLRLGVLGGWFFCWLGV